MEVNERGGENGDWAYLVQNFGPEMHSNNFQRFTK